MAGPHFKIFKELMMRLNAVDGAPINLFFAHLNTNDGIVSHLCTPVPNRPVRDIRGFMRDPVKGGQRFHWVLRLWADPFASGATEGAAMWHYLLWHANFDYAYRGLRTRQ